MAAPNVETIEIPLATLSAQVAPSTANETARTVDVVWSSGAPVRRFDFLGDEYLLRLSLDPRDVDLTRLRSGAPVLNAHQRGDVADVVGVVESATVNGQEGRARIRFSERSEVEPVWHDVRNGILRNVSVGIEVTELQDVSEEGDKLPTFLASKYTPAEISLVPIGADAGAQVLSAQTKTRCTVRRKAKGGRNVEETTTTEPTGNPEGSGPETMAERERVTEILTLGKRLGDAPWVEALANKAVADGWDLERFRRVGLDRRADEDLQLPPTRGINTMGMAEWDSLESRASLMVDALCARRNPAAADPQNPYLGTRIVDLAKEILDARRVRHVSFGTSRLMELALHSTSDFPQLFAGVANKTLRDAYDAAPQGVKSVARQTTAADFKTKFRLMLGEFPDLEKVNEHGEFTRGTMAEAQESYKLETFGRIFGITRQALVNDDLGAFTDLAARAGRAVVEFEAQNLVDLLTSNAGAGPTMSDAVALFHANHGNLAASGGDIAEGTLGAARLAMRTQTGLAGKNINVTPRSLVVPAALETTAQKVLATIQPTTTTDVNVFAGSQLELHVEPRLDAVSATRWYVAADPAVFDGLEYAYLEGEPGPQTSVREGFDVDGVEVKVRLDFGCGFVDWRSWYRNDG